MTNDERHEKMMASFAKNGGKFAKLLLADAEIYMRDNFHDMPREQQAIIISAYVNAASNYAIGCLAEPQS